MELHINVRQGRCIRVTHRWRGLWPIGIVSIMLKPEDCRLKSECASSALWRRRRTPDEVRRDICPVSLSRMRSICD